jgi:Flp pilus assembly protein TadD
LAAVRIEQKDIDGGLKILREATVKLGHPDVMVMELTGLLQRLGRQDEAIAAYEEALKARPGSDLVANNLAMLLVTARADAAGLKRAGELSARFAQSRNPNFLDTDGFVLLRQGQAAQALPVLERAVSLAPDAAVIRYHLALAQFEAGQKQAARDNLERALQGKQEFDGIAEARSKLVEWKQAG